jgi:Uma2 family endonuclease
MIMTTVMIAEEEEISDYEQERGKPMPSFEHAMTQRAIIVLLQEYTEYLALPELSLTLEGWKSVPDIAVFPKTLTKELRTMHKTTVLLPPLLTVEILSPKQALADLFEKAEAFLRHGVAEAWVIVPEIKTITVFRPNEEPKTFLSGAIQHCTTEITVNVEQVFHV